MHPAVLTMAAILLAGTALRVSYLREIVAAPDLATPIADAAFHDYWARGLAYGKWDPPEGETDPRLSAVPFLRPPGYPYFLALVYRVVGPGVVGPRLVQMGLGIVNCVLAFLLGRALGGTAVGHVTAASCAVYWALIYFEGELQAPVLIQAVSLLAILALCRWSRVGARAWVALGGSLCGLLALVRPNALLFVPIAAIWVAWVARRHGTARSTTVATFAGAAILVISVATIRNAIVARDFVLISSNGAVNFYIGNNPESDGVTARVPDLEDIAGFSRWSWFSYDRIVKGVGRLRGDPNMSHSDVSAFFVRRAGAWIRSHPIDFLRLTARRALLFWGPNEISNNKAIRFEKENSPTLRANPGFAWVLGPALVGAFLAARNRAGFGSPRHEGIVLVGLFVITTFVSFVPFLAAARFRVPLLPFLFVFGAYGLVRIAAWARHGDWSRAAATVAAGGGLIFLIGSFSRDTETDEAWWHTDRGAALRAAGNPQTSLDEFEAALAVNPGFVDAHVHLARALAELDRPAEAAFHLESVLTHRPYRNDLRLELGRAYLRLERFDEAARALRAAVLVDPESAECHFELGRALTEAGRYRDGIEAFRESLRLLADQPGAHTNVGIALASLGRHREAIAEYHTSLELDPFSSEAHYNLGRALEAIGSREEAEAAYREAVRVEPKHVEPLIHLGNVLNETGRFAEAVSWYERALAVAPGEMTARYNLAGALGNLGRFDEAVTVLETGLELDPTHQPCRERLSITRRFMAGP